MDIYKPKQQFRLPDKTLLATIFSNNDVSNDFLDKLSLSIGEIPTGKKSEIHLHPIVTQVTFVLHGDITILTKKPGDKTVQAANLVKHDTIVTLPNTFFQLFNASPEKAAEVLYIVNPAFMFLLDEDGAVKFNDALILGQDWDRVEDQLAQIDLAKFLRQREELKKALQHAD